MNHVADAMQEARIACWLCSYKVGIRDVAFWPYAKLRVRGAVIDYFRRMRVIQRESAQIKTVGLDFRLAVKKINVLAGLEVEELLLLLPSLRDRDMLRRRYMNGEDFVSLGKRYGITTGTATTTVSLSLQAIRRALRIEKQ